MSKTFNKNIPYTFNPQITLPSSSSLSVTGNVGIGTTAPSVKLHISGESIFFQSDFGNRSWTIENPTGGNTTNPIRFNTNNAWDFQTDNISRLYIDDAGDVGIGTTAPAHKLDVIGTIDATTYTGANIMVSGSIGSLGSIDAGSQFLGQPNDSATAPSFSWTGDTNTGIYRPITDMLGFVTNGLERMRINTGGNVGIRTSAPTTALDVNGATLIRGAFQCGGTTGGSYKISSDSDPYAYFGPSLTPANTGDARLNVQDRVNNCISFYAGTTKQGGITASGGTTAYNTTSDYRVKENIVDIQNACNRVKQLRVRRFNFIEHPEKIVDGFLAHEAAEVVPEAVHGEKDVVDADGNPILQQIDQSKLVPLLTGALKEAILKIESLEHFIQSKFPGEYNL